MKSNQRPYPTCTLPTDLFHLPTVKKAVPLEFAHCRPSKSSLKTLGASGSTLGLAPSEHLRYVLLRQITFDERPILTMNSQTRSTSILQQLLEKEAIQRPIFSLMLINGHEGVLSIGGTAASAIEMIVSQTRHELDRLGMIERGEVLADETADDTTPVMPLPADMPDTDGSKRLTKRGRRAKDVVPRQASWEDGWAWSRVQGAEGWWQVLMQSVYVDGVKVLQNQAVVIDVGLPVHKNFDTVRD